MIWISFFEGKHSLRVSTINCGQVKGFDSCCASMLNNRALSSSKAPLHINGYGYLSSSWSKNRDLTFDHPLFSISLVSMKNPFKSSLETYTIPLKFTNSKHLVCQLFLNGVEGNFLIDTGASNSCLDNTLTTKFSVIRRR